MRWKKKLGPFWLFFLFSFFFFLAKQRLIHETTFTVFCHNRPRNLRENWIFQLQFKADSTWNIKQCLFKNLKTSFKMQMNVGEVVLLQLAASNSCKDNECGHKLIVLPLVSVNL